ncbi:MAG TPA: PAS domain S-box protein [Pilimelia sp.]|nr:PAS domain S-box protein [Pilimelia sp.]
MRHSDNVMAELALALTAAASRPAAVLDTAVRACAALLDGVAMVRLRDGEDLLELAAVHHDDAAVAERFRDMFLAERGVPRQRVTEGFSGLVLDSRRPCVVNLPPERPRTRTLVQYEAFVQEMGLRAALIAPMFADEAYLGYLAVVRGDQPRRFGDADVVLAEDIAVRVALALNLAQYVEKTRLSEERYRRIVETTNEGIAQLDTAGRVVFANDRLAQILGEPADRLLGRTLARFLPAHDPDGRHGRLSAGFVSEPASYEQRLVRPDGAELWVNISAAAVPGADGGSDGVLAMVADITDRVRARRLQQQLDQRSRLDSLGTLAGGVAHDFNNLLGIIGGFADMVRDERDPAEREFAIGHIARAVAKGAQLTDQLLAFARGRPAAAEIVDVTRLVREMTPLLRQAAGADVTLWVVAAEPLPPVAIAPGQLEQVLVNLVVNARDAMAGRGHLRVECLDRTVDESLAGDSVYPLRPGRYVRLAVSDTGHGMDETTQRRAFEPFFTTKPHGAGGGMGLAGVYGLVRAAGGHVGIRSQPGVGTTVKVFLPAAREPADLPAGPRRPAGAAAGGRVLVVEDNADLAAIVERMLRDTAYEATVFTDAAAALAAVAAGLRPQLLLTDVVMPRMNGPQLAAELRARLPGLGVVYMSGYTAGALTMNGQLDVGAPLVEKPFRRQELLAALAEAAAARAGGAAAAG